MFKLFGFEFLSISVNFLCMCCELNWSDLVLTWVCRQSWLSLSFYFFLTLHQLKRDFLIILKDLLGNSQSMTKLQMPWMPYDQIGKLVKEISFYLKYPRWIVFENYIFLKFWLQFLQHWVDIVAIFQIFGFEKEWQSIWAFFFKFNSQSALDAWHILITKLQAVINVHIVI